MRKLKIFGVLLAVLVFGAIATASAFASDEWLANGKLVPLGAKLAAVTTGTWLLLALGFGGLSTTHVLCHGELLGTINGLNASGKGTDTVTEIHNLTLTELKTIECEGDHSDLGICSGLLPVFVTAINLPWLTELFLEPGDTTARDRFTSTVSGKEPGFKVECMTGTGGTFTESCEGNVVSEQLKNELGGVVGGKLPEQASKSCSGGNVGHTNGSGTIKLENGEALSVS